MREKSDENWKVGCVCLQNNQLNAAANRLYYSVFQAVLHFAKEKKGYVSKKNSSVHKEMLGFVRKTGKHGNYYGKQFNRLRSYRETADYEPNTPNEGRLKKIVDDSEIMRKFFLRKAGD